MILIIRSIQITSNNPISLSLCQNLYAYSRMLIQT